MTEAAFWRNAVYLIPYFVDSSGSSQWCYLEFSRGVGFIGGGVEGAETNLEAIQREVKEEVLDARFDFGRLRELTQKYEFYNPVRKVNERHTYFMLLLPNKLELKSAESAVKIAWADSDKVLSLLEYDEQRSFLVKQIKYS